MYSNFLCEKIELKGKDTKQFEVKLLVNSDLEAVLNMQKEVMSAFKNNSILQPSTKEEILESMEKDCCIGVYYGGELAAFAIIVLNRCCDRNLGSDWESKEDKKTFESYVTFDSVQVHPLYRGYGIQKYLLRSAEKIAGETEARYIAATVSPDNPYSLNNFEAMGYYRHPEKNPYSKYSSQRILVRKDI